MTVSTIGSIAEFDTNGVTTNYPFYFKFLANEDLVVTYVDPAGTSSTLALGTHYTVNGAGNDSGGSIVTTAALAGPGQLIVSREMDAYQQTSLRNQGKFLAETHEDVFDRLTMLIQQGFAIFTRALTRPFGRDYFFAENRRITSVKDPEEAQDAATKHWAEIYVGSVIASAQGPFNLASNVAYIFPDGVARTVQDLSNKIMANLGLNGIGYRGRTAAEAFQGLGVSPEDYGALNNFGTTDSTDGVMAAFNAAKALKRPLIWSGNYGATHVDFNQPNGVTIIGGGTLTALSASPQESVLTLKNFADFRLYGRLVVSASFKLNYAAGVAIYTDTGGGASQFDISGLVVVGAQVGVRIGRRTEENALLSEATFFGGNFYGCPTCYELIGTQTVINFIGCNMITGVNGAPAPVAAAWAQLPRTAVRSIGASYTVTGGEALIVEVASGILFDNRPIASAAFGNRYGNMSLNNCTIESASQVSLFWNPENIPSMLPGVGSARMINCDGYHSQNSLPVIQTYDDFPGSITAIANPIFCNMVRTVDNISVGLATCDIYVDDNSFGKNFKRGLSGVSGGKLHFTFRQIAELQNFNGQSLPLGLTDLRPTTAISTGDLARSFINYNGSTGVMTTLQSFRTLTVSAQYQTAGLTTGDTYVVVDGVNVGIVANNRLVQIEKTLHEVPAGTAIKIQVNNAGSSGQSALAGVGGVIQLSACNI